MDCRVRLIQSDAALGDLRANLERHSSAIGEAARDGIDLVVFPELSLTGFFLKDQTAEVALALDAPEVLELAQRSRDVSFVVGLVERARDGRLYNASCLFEDGALAHVHRKVHLVSYGMFEEGRDLAAGESFRVAESKHGRFGILTCEDMWHVPGGYLYFLDGADALLVPSAGPGRGVAEGEPQLESVRVWRTLQDAAALLYRTWVLYANRIGWEDGVAFGGGTRAVDPFGRPAGELTGLDAGGLDVRIDSDTLQHARVQTPLRRDEKPWLLARELLARTGFDALAERGSFEE